MVTDSMLVATSTVAVLVSRFADAFTPMSNLATRDQMADREKGECRQVPRDPEPAATHTHKEHLRSLAARLKKHGGLSNTAAERWVKKWDSIAGMLEHNLIGAGGLLLETVDDLVRELTPGGAVWGCHGSAHVPFSSVAAASGGDARGQVSNAAEWRVVDGVSWSVCLGKSRGGSAPLLQCCRVHNRQPLNFALNHDIRTSHQGECCSCMKKCEPRWGHMVQLKMINSFNGLQKDLCMRVDWSERDKREHGAGPPPMDIYQIVLQDLPATSSLLIEDPTLPGQWMIKSTAEFEGLPLFPAWDLVSSFAAKAYRTPPLAMNPGTLSACHGEVAGGGAQSGVSIDIALEMVEDSSDPLIIPVVKQNSAKTPLPGGAIGIGGHGKEAEQSIIPLFSSMGEPSRPPIATFNAERSHLQRIPPTTIDGKGKGKGLPTWAQRDLDGAWATCVEEVPGAASLAWAQQMPLDEFPREKVLQLTEDEAVDKAKRRKLEAQAEAKAYQEAMAESQCRAADQVISFPSELTHAQTVGRTPSRAALKNLQRFRQLVPDILHTRSKPSLSSAESREIVSR